MKFFNMMLFFGLILSNIAQAQTTKNKDEPITIEASGGIDWVRDKFYYFAKDAVIIEQGTFKITADQVQIDYEIIKGKDAKETTAYKKLTAVGNVKFYDTDISGAGDKLLWFFADERGELYGNKAKFINKETTINANKSIFYDKKLNQGKALGAVKVVDPKQTIEADDMVAVFYPKDEAPKSEIKNKKNTDDKNSEKKSSIKSAKANGNVKVITQSETITGANLTYESEEKLAVICGSVVILRDKNKFSGDCANLNTETQQSSLVANKATGGRVKAVIQSNEKDKKITIGQ